MSTSVRPRRRRSFFLPLMVLVGVALLLFVNQARVASVRKIKARTTEDLDRAVVTGLQLITESDCRGWFKHCGYQVA